MIKYIIRKKEIIKGRPIDITTYLGQKKTTCSVDENSETFKAFVKEYGHTDKEAAKISMEMHEMTLMKATEKIKGLEYKVALLEIEIDETSK